MDNPFYKRKLNAHYGSRYQKTHRTKKKIDSRRSIEFEKILYQFEKNSLQHIFIHAFTRVLNISDNINVSTFSLGQKNKERAKRELLPGTI